MAGSAANTVTVTGTNFINATIIQVAGNPRPTVFVGATQLTFQLSAGDLSSAGSINITAVNPPPGGGASAAAAIAVNNPVPGMPTLSPNAIATGTSTPTTITVTGTNFLPVSTVQLGGSPRTTTYVSGTQLTFQLTTADEATSANLNVTVINPTPGGGVSTPQTITVAPSTTPIISSVSPNVFLAGSPSTTISVYGKKLTAATQIQWNGPSLTTTPVYIGSTLYNLAAPVPANLLSAAGTANVTLYNSATTPTTSANFPVTIIDPPPPTINRRRAPPVLSILLPR